MVLGNLDKMGVQANLDHLVLLGHPVNEVSQGHQEGLVTKETEAQQESDELGNEENPAGQVNHRAEDIRWDL